MNQPVEAIEPTPHDKRKRIIVVCLGIWLLVVCIAFPAIFFLSGSEPPPQVTVPELPDTAGVAKLAVPAPLTMDLDPTQLAGRLSALLQAKPENPPELRRISRALAGAGEGSSSLLIGILKEWNHPILFEAASLLGAKGFPALPHLESLLDYLDTVCSDERLGTDDPNAPVETPEWIGAHVTCEQRDVLRTSVQDTWLAIKQAEGPLLKRNWSGSNVELNRALVNSVQRERLAMVKHLLGVGAYVNGVGQSSDGSGRMLTPLMAAMKNNSTAILELLVQVGADTDFRVWYPLSEAIRANRKDRILFLLRRGVSLNRQDALGEFPLTLAAESGDIELVKLLLNRGASAYLRNKNGKSAREIAVAQPKSDLYAVIFEAIDTNGRSPESTLQH